MKRISPALHRLAVTVACLLSLPTLRAGIIAYPDGAGVAIREDGGSVLEFSFVAWGPKWAHTGFKGGVTGEGSSSRGEFTAKLGGTQAPLSVRTEFARPAAHELRLKFEAETGADTEVTLLTAAFEIGERFASGKAFAATAEGEAEVKLPLGRQGMGKGVRKVRLLDAAGAETVLEFAPAVDIASDGAARVVLAQGRFAAGEKRAVEITVKMPGEITWYPTVAAIPPPENWDHWFPWAGTGEIPDDSALGMARWLEAPAGRHGRVAAKGDKLMYNGKPAVFWGINVCYASTAPEKELAEKRARFYASHGVNAVRLHKYADGHGWAGILNGQSFTEFDPEALDRMDYFVAQLKERGIFIKLSPTFGTFRLGPKDAERVPYFEEFAGKAKRADKNGVTSPPSGAYLGTELRDLQIEQMLNLLKHKNPYTGLTYAEDPAIMVVELLNEQSILFFTTIATLKNSPTLRRRAAERFTGWLLERYGSKEAVLARWGEGGLNAMAAEGFSGESFEEKSIVPAGNPWFWDPAQLEGSQAPRKARHFDTMRFLYEMQNEFYAFYTKALRDAGYKGEVLSSNWQAGRAFSHYYNLHSDTLTGLIDRHNYFNGAAPMIGRPCSGMMSAGMQQVVDRPFMLSEWIHVFPTRYPSEGPAILGAYGMGLQGWDVSYMFQNRDKGGYDESLGGDRWVVMQPEVMGLFPAIARHVLRGDVKESPVTVARSVHVPSLDEGRLGFDDQVKQGYDDKSFDSKTVPAAAMAAVRSVVAFDNEFKETPGFDMAPYLKDGAIVSSTGQLVWTPGTSASTGFFTMDTPGTKAVVGFAAGKPHALGEATITTETPYAAVYLTAAEKDATVATGKRLLLVAIARAHNDGMKYVESGMLARGQAPVRMEPVRARIDLRRPGQPEVHVLDHNGARTGKKIPARNGSFTVDGAETRACYYEIAY